VTTAYTADPVITAPADVYAPQEDSLLLIQAIADAGLAPGARVADLCTGSGVVALAAAAQGAARVSAFDICPRAVATARANASAAGADVAVHRGSWARAVEFGPYDLVVSNPPYVPVGADDSFYVPGPTQAWDAGADGRMVLDPLCAAAPMLLAEGGSMLLVHSECSNVGKTVSALQDQGMTAEVVAEQTIPFGPVMTARAPWLMDTGLLPRGCRMERIVVVRADAP
jgi:release factor glutamine methyltransferase